MEIFRQWAFSLVISGIAGTVVSLLAPRGNTEKALRTVIGVFVVCVLCSPLAELGGEADFPSFSFEETEAVNADLLAKQMEDSCRQSVAIAAKEIAAQFGIAEYNVDVDMYVDDEFCIIIQEIYILLPAEYSGVADAFSENLQARLGVPVTAECK